MTKNAHANAGTNVAAQPKTVRVISVTSGKGGVGKTNIATNLGIALAKKGQKVLVWDADLGLANVDVILGLNALYNIKDLLSGEKRLEEIIIDGPAGIKIMPASSGIQEMAHLGEDQKRRLLDDLDDYDDDLDFLLIDTGAGISSNVMYFNMAAQERIIVVTAEPTSITDAYALIKVMTTRYNQKRFKILVNQVPNAQEANAVFKLLSSVADKHLGSISMDYLGYIPIDEYVTKAVRKQRAVVESYPSSEASRSLEVLAKKILKTSADPGLDGSIKFFWKRLLKI